MIVATPKPVTELKRVIAGHSKVLFVGCGTCVTVCLAGGEREVGLAGYAMRMARKLDNKPIQIDQVTIERQCENEFIQELAPAAQNTEAIVSFACGAGVQALAERFPNKPVYAGLNTQFLGILEEQAVWTEKCLGCGNCVLSDFGGICPVTRCAKRMLNGPCGGSCEDKCEVSKPAERPCAWQLIYKRMEAIGQLDKLNQVYPAKDWRPSWHAGARTIVREEHRI
ncbi:MAG TPA: methylenetetrahydrofolate reductase C-terminal domain-containing protein [Planctomycetota bacterium]|jgi:ferredoxin